jgi:hypothetical protein
MKDSAIRPWCATARYPGLDIFRVGTVCLPATARHDEIEAALHAHAGRFLPPGLQIVEPLCGALFFVSGGDRDA